MALSCTGEDFYTASRDWDLRRIPLVKPYVLHNVTDEQIDDHTDWSLKYDLENTDSSEHINVSFVNACGNIIYGYGKHNPTGKFIIRVQERTFMTYSNEIWREELLKLNCDPDSLYLVWDVWYRFSKTGELPWRKKSSDLRPPTSDL